MKTILVTFAAICFIYTGSASASLFNAKYDFSIDQLETGAKHIETHQCEATLASKKIEKRDLGNVPTIEDLDGTILVAANWGHTSVTQ